MLPIRNSDKSERSHGLNLEHLPEMFHMHSPLREMISDVQIFVDNMELLAGLLKL